MGYCFHCESYKFGEQSYTHTIINFFPGRSIVFIYYMVIFVQLHLICGWVIQDATFDVFLWQLNHTAIPCEFGYPKWGRLFCEHLQIGGLLNLRGLFQRFKKTFFLECMVIWILRTHLWYCNTTIHKNYHNYVKSKPIFLHLVFLECFIKLKNIKFLRTKDRKSLWSDSIWPSLRIYTKKR